MQPRAPFMVMAHHRSGSNFLNDLLQAHPRIECLNEPFSMHTRYFRARDLEIWGEQEFDRALLHPSLIGDAELRSFLVEFRRYLLQSNRLRLMGFKETALFGKLGWLKGFMPSLKILFLKRDPRAIVSSVLRSGLASFWDYERLVPRAFCRLYPAYASRVPPGDAPARAAELAAMSVVARYELARATLGLFEHRVVYLDELSRKPVQCLRAISQFLDVEPDPGQLLFLGERQSTSRGGLFSSFRVHEEVEHTWRRHLSVRQVQAVEDVLMASQHGGV
jgi:hypothetical protein